MRQSEWARLFKIAHSLIEQVNAEHTIIDRWSFGGGTAMMIQIDHRESHDVDIFITDAQLLGYLNPATKDFKFEIPPSEYEGDGTTHRKLAFADIGEIDFIVADTFTTNPTTTHTIEGIVVELETVAEIIAKKVHYRGKSIKPRDVFDIAAAAQSGRAEIIDTLSKLGDDVKATLFALDRLNPEFVTKTISQLAIRKGFEPLVNDALQNTRDILSAALLKAKG